ncbi:MAG: LysR family transcriptional regulator [Acidimicrobiales bacterium]
MTLNQLRTLVAVADAGSVRAASERLVISQPAVSGAIATLERELGVELVEPEGRGLRFTEAGRAFIASVRAGLSLIEAGARQAASIDAPAHGSVRIAAITTAAERLLPSLLAELRRRYPAAQLAVQVGNRAKVFELLEDGSADLVVAGRPARSLRARTLGRTANQLVVVGPRLASDKPPNQTDLAKATWLLREEGSGTREATEALLGQLGIDPPRMILGSNGAVEQAAIAGVGLALISLDAVAGSLSGDRLSIYQCRGTPLDRPWHLLGPARRLSPTAVLAATTMLTVPGGFAPSVEGRRVLALARSFELRSNGDGAAAP